MAHACLADATLRAPEHEVPRHAVVLGDPQGPFRQILDVLDRHGVLSSEGWIARDVELICVGDYFDFRTDDVVSGAFDGMLLLSWLAAHDSRQVTLLIGNHDIERVCSLASATEEEMAEARRGASYLEHLPGRMQRRAFLLDWAQSHVHRVPIIAARDYACFHQDQPALVRRLLLNGRLQVATTATILRTQEPALVTHAGITRRMLTKDGWSADPHALAASLNARLKVAVERTRPDWEAGKTTPLVFDFHVPWTPLRPCSGMLVQRPRNKPEVDRHHHHLGLDEPFVERSLPIEQFLIPGLVQIVGHTRTSHLCDMIGAWHGSAPPNPLPYEPLTLDLLEDASDWLGPLSEVVTRPAVSRMVFTDLGFQRSAHEVMRLLEVEPGNARS